MDSCCRACSRRDGFRRFSLYAVAEVNQELIADMIRDTSDTQVSTEDGLPQQICPDCLMTLSLAYTFRKQCRQSDAKFREFWSSRTSTQQQQPHSQPPPPHSQPQTPFEGSFDPIGPTPIKNEMDIPDYEYSITSADNSQWVIQTPQAPAEPQAEGAMTVVHNTDGQYYDESVAASETSESMVYPTDDPSEIGECSSSGQNLLQTEESSPERYSQRIRRQDMPNCESPLLVDRTNCFDGVDKWRHSVDLLHPVAAPPIKHSNLPEPSNPHPPKGALAHLPRSQWTAQALISRTKKGRMILEAYNTTNILSRKDRFLITRLIVDEFLDEFGKLTREELALRSAELKRIFPTVEEHVWYQPPHYCDESGKKIKLGKVAKGCLYDRNHNYRSIVSAPTTPMSNAIESPSSSVRPIMDGVTAEAVKAYQETKKLFRLQNGEWDDIRKQWQATSAVRLHELSRLEQVTYQHLLDEYPVLRSATGHQLVLLDFAFKYPEKIGLLFANFADFRDCAKVVFRNEIPDQGKALLASMLSGELAEDSRNCITTMLLFFIWPSKFVRLPHGKKWKPSVHQSYERSILHLKSLADYETELSKLTQQNLLRGLPDCPVIVVVGATIEHINQFLVSYKGIAYRTETFLKALDVAFKIYKAYDIGFPIEGIGPWSFIAHMLYDFEPSEEGNKPRILTLAAALRNQLPAQ